MRELTLEEQKNILLDILSDFDRVCRENDIAYSIAYGTLLGAVRHKGFIPWDDDVDVTVTRADYEKLRKILNDKLEKDHRFICTEDEKRFSAPLAKIIDTRTVLRQLEHHSDRMDLGVYIDIFVLDYIPNDPAEREKVLKKSVFYRKLWSFSATVNEENTAPLRFVRRIANRTSAARNIALKINRWAANASKDRDFVNILTFNDDDKEIFIMESRDAADLTEYDFEGHSFLGIKAYDKYLTRWYGDYMTPPPEEERVTHHVTEVFWKE